MKILILSTMYPNPRLWLSGIFVQEQVKALQKLGIETIVYSPIPYVPPFFEYFSEKWKLLKEFPNEEIIDEIKVNHTKYLAIPGGFFKQYWGIIYSNNVYKDLSRKNLLNEIDIIHAHGVPDEQAGYLLSKRINKPLVITEHGDAVYRLYKQGNRFNGSKIALQNADLIIAVSSQIKKLLKKVVNRERNVEIILNGFIPNELNKDYKSFKYKTDKNNINILFVAGLIERKGLQFLLPAFKELVVKYNNIKLIIAGGGPLFQEMKKLSVNLGIENYTDFLGYIEHDDVMKLMSECDIFTLPSWDEAFGVVYLEAMSFKKPVIGTINEGICDVVVDGVNGFLVRPKNVEDIVSKLSLLIENKDLRIKMGELGYESIKKLTWAENAKKMINEYNKLIENKVSNKNISQE